MACGPEPGGWNQSDSRVSATKALRRIIRTESEWLHSDQEVLHRIAKLILHSGRSRGPATAGEWALVSHLQAQNIFALFLISSIKIVFNFCGKIEKIIICFLRVNCINNKFCSSYISSATLGYHCYKEFKKDVVQGKSKCVDDSNEFMQINEKKDNAIWRKIIIRYFQP